MAEPSYLTVPFWSWIILAAVVLTSVSIDLFAHRGNREQSRTAAIVWSGIWISLAVAFGGWVFLQFGREAGQDYFAAWLVEKSLSVDNLFVFLVVFRRLGIPKEEQHRVLQWGILGAFLTRAVFIGCGAALLSAWHGVVYVLGAFLIYTGIKTAREQATGEGSGEEGGKILAFLRRHLRVTPNRAGHHFFTVENGRRLATPLFLALLVIEVTDILFAVDSIPAVFAVSEDPFIVYSSNVFAVLGLRALYLVLADLLDDLKYLRFGLAAILVFAGAKMLTSSFIHVPHVASLAVIIGVLAVTIIPSVIARRRHRRERSRTKQLRPA